MEIVEQEHQPSGVNDSKTIPVLSPCGCGLEDEQQAAGSQARVTGGHGGRWQHRRNYQSPSLL